MSIGNILLCAFLIIFGASVLIGTAIPGWVPALLAIGAGVLLLMGR